MDNIKIDKMAVIGNPIAHSLSPMVYSLFAHEFGFTINYEKIEAHSEVEFEEVLKRCFDLGYLWLNITSPYKRIAYELIAKRTMRALFCKSGNFIYKNKDGVMVIDSTDGLGLLDDIKHNLATAINEKKILILGSGFVLEAILLDLIVENPALIAILARNNKRVQELQQRFKTTNFDASQNYDIIINTALNVPDNKLFDKIKYLRANTLCYDLSYASELTFFHQQMRQLNPQIRSQNGLGMLVAQAKINFNKIYGLTPNSHTVIQTLSTYC